MVQRLLFVLILLVTIIFSSHCQSNYLAGTITTKERQTLKGFIELTSDFQLSISCNFKAEENSNPTTLFPNELSSYSFNNGKTFLSREVTIGLDTISIFLEQIIKGKASLLGALNSYFLEKDSILYELTSKKINGIESGTYLQTFKKILSDCPKISKLSLNTSKTDESPRRNYINIIQLYNSCSLSPAKTIKLLFYPYLGTSISNLLFSPNSNTSLTSFSSKRIFNESPFLTGISVEWRNRIKNKKVNMLTGLLINQTRFYYSSLNTDRTIFSEIDYNKSSINFLIGPKLKIYENKKIEITTTIQPGLSRILTQDSYMTIETSNGNSIYNDEYLFSERKTNYLWAVGLIGSFQLKNSVVFTTISFFNERSNINILNPSEDTLTSKLKSLQFLLGIKI